MNEPIMRVGGEAPAGSSGSAPVSTN